MRFAAAYILLTSLVLVFLNSYASDMTRQLLYRSKETSLLDKVQLITSSFSGVETLTADNTAQVISVLGNLNVDRVLVTDGTGQALYDDSQGEDTAVGRYVLLRPVAEAMAGQNVFYCRYESGLLMSYAAAPITFYGSVNGCVYLLDLDYSQGAIIQGLEQNLARISWGLAAGMVLFSLVFAVITSGKMRRILTSMELVREGEYSHKIAMHGGDEYGRLAGEFNKLTDRLQASEQAQRQFVSDASHELKTPLASIKLLSDSILQNDMDAETMREFVADIGSEADRLTRMAQKLLTLTKAESVQDGDREVVDLSRIIGQVFKMLIPLADQREIRLKCTMDKDCAVLTLEDDVYQIIFNLVENAIKYNHDGGQVHVRLQRRGDDVVIQVEDTGVGIPPDAMEHIFERFYRVDKARSRQAGGSGLGLSIVHDLVERNFGEIQVEPREEGGTRFTVVFPYFDMEVAE